MPAGCLLAGRKRAAQRPSRAAICRRRRAAETCSREAEAGLSRVAMAPANYFPPPPARGRLCIAKQNSCPAPSSAALRPCGPAGATRLRLRQGIAVKAAMGAADPPARKAPAMSHDDSILPFPDTDTDRRTAHRLADRASARRARALRPSPRPGRARSAAAARARRRAGPARRHGRGASAPC